MANVGGLDQNSRRTLSALSSVDNTTIVNLWADPTTHRLLTDASGSGGGITSINGDTTNAQSLVVGTTGTDFAIVDDLAGTHTFNLPSASATARGVVTTTSQTIAGAKTFSTAPILSSLTVSQILALDGSGNVQSLAVATYPSLTELSYVKGVTSAIQTQINAKGTGTVTAVSVVSANGFTGSSSGGATPALTLTTSINAPILAGNGTAIAAATTTGTGSTAVLATSPSLTTPTLGVATATSINKMAITAPATGSTLAVADGKTLTASNTLTLAGTDSTTMTFPSTSASVARTDAAQTFTGTQTFANTVLTANAITASGNAATVPVTSGRNIVTNNSAATLTITLTTSGAVNMQTCMVQVLDFSGVAQTISWVNTENSTVSAPTTSNGSTTLPLTVGFVYNSATSKWRCVASS